MDWENTENWLSSKKHTDFSHSTGCGVESAYGARQTTCTVDSTGEDARLGTRVAGSRRARQRRGRGAAFSGRMPGIGRAVPERRHIPQPCGDGAAWFRAWRVQVFQLSAA